MTEATPEPSEDEFTAAELGKLATASRKRKSDDKKAATGDTFVEFLDLINSKSLTTDEIGQLGQVLNAIRNRDAGTNVLNALTTGTSSTPSSAPTPAPPAASASSSSSELAALQLQLRAQQTLIDQHEKDVQTFVKDNGGQNVGTNDGKYLVSGSLNSVKSSFERKLEAATQPALADDVILKTEAEQAKVKAVDEAKAAARSEKETAVKAAVDAIKIPIRTLVTDIGVLADDPKHGFRDSVTQTMKAGRKVSVIDDKHGDAIVDKVEKIGTIVGLVKANPAPPVPPVPTAPTPVS